MPVRLLIYRNCEIIKVFLQPLSGGDLLDSNIKQIHLASRESIQMFIWVFPLGPWFAIIGRNNQGWIILCQRVRNFIVSVLDMNCK